MSAAPETNKSNGHDAKRSELMQRAAAAMKAGDFPKALGVLQQLVALDHPEAQRTADQIATVLEQWRTAGPLLHEPTGIAGLDQLTGGGPVYGTRWYVSGAPDAGKTALLVQVAHTYAQHGIAVGLLAVDEEAGDIVTRLAQRVGYSRHHCEARDPGVLAQMRAALSDLPIRFYDDRWSIESAAADLAQWATAEKRRSMLGIDSVQTVSCAAEQVAHVVGREMGMAEAVTARCRAIRAVATAHRHIVLATSELGRQAYAARDTTQRTSILASSKWSGTIEYSARVVLGLTSVPGETDLLDLELAKNKHGPQARQGDPTTAHVFLRIDRRSQTLTEADYDPPPDPGASERDERSREQVTADAETVLALITAEPGVSTRDLYAASKAASGLSRPRVDAAVRALGDRVERRAGPRDSRLHYPAGGAP
ncbi:MAG: hypothetical protein AMXMBFR56_81720 [Polyangiaceae bacterium]